MAVVQEARKFNTDRRSKVNTRNPICRIFCLTAYFGWWGQKGQLNLGPPTHARSLGSSLSIAVEGPLPSSRQNFVNLVRRDSERRGCFFFGRCFFAVFFFFGFCLLFGFCWLLASFGFLVSFEQLELLQNRNVENQSMRTIKSCYM